MTSGRRNNWEKCSHKFMGISTTVAFAVFSALPPTSRPSSCLSKSGISSAMKSMTFVFNATSAVMEALSSTADLAQAHAAIPFFSDGLGEAGGVVLDFLFITSSVFSTSPLKPSSTGCAAPMRVCGAITATSAAMVMNTASSARARRRRRHINHRGHFRGVEFLDDLRGGIHQPTRRVEVDDEEVVALGRGDVNRAGNVAGRGRADGAVNLDQADLRRVGNDARKSDPTIAIDKPTLHSFPNPTANLANRAAAANPISVPASGAGLIIWLSWSNTVAARMAKKWLGVGAVSMGNKNQGQFMDGSHTFTNPVWRDHRVPLPLSALEHRPRV